VTFKVLGVGTRNGAGDAMALPAVGDEILGKYRILRKLGEGGMGVVYAALHIELQETVAIKMLSPSLAMRDDVVGRFMREARAAAKIKNEHAVRVLDVGKFEDGVPYMVMEFLDGEDLETTLMARGPLPLPEVIKYVAEAAIALSEAHRQGIVHRDIKPANLFLAKRSNGSRIIKIVDFGISKVANDGLIEGGATRTDSVMGTPMYMSPEQLRASRDVDARADVWSLGIVFYRLLTGISPFDGDTVPLLFVSIFSSKHRSLRERRPDLPIELESILARCLEKDRDKRMSSVEEFVMALAPWAGSDAPISFGRESLASGNWAASAAGPSGISSGVGTTDSKLTADQAQTHRARSFRMLGIAVFSAVIVVVGGLAAWKLLGNEPAAQSAGATSSAAAGNASSLAAQSLARPEPLVAPQASVEAATSTALPVVTVAPSKGNLAVKTSEPLSTAKRPAGPAVKPTATSGVFDVGGRK
jgi:serine/threonine-protein kinase